MLLRKSILFVSVLLFSTIFTGNAMTANALSLGSLRQCICNCYEGFKISMQKLKTILGKYKLVVMLSSVVNIFTGNAMQSSQVQHSLQYPQVYQQQVVSAQSVPLQQYQAPQYQQMPQQIAQQYAVQQYATGGYQAPFIMQQPQQPGNVVSPQQSTVRLFIAVPMPVSPVDAHGLNNWSKVQSYIENKINPIVTPLRGSVARENMPHMSLLFLGDVQASQLPLLDTVLRNAVVQFNAWRGISGALTGFWMNSGATILGNAITLSVGAQHTYLDGLVHYIRESLRTYNLLPASALPFKAHVTINRINPRSLLNNQACMLQVQSILPSIQPPVGTRSHAGEYFNINGFGLYQSQGGSYTMLQQYIL